MTNSFRIEGLLVILTQVLCIFQLI